MVPFVLMAKEEWLQPVRLQRIDHGRRIRRNFSAESTSLFTSATRSKIIVEEVVQQTGTIIGSMVFWKKRTKVDEAPYIYLGSRDENRWQ